MPRDRDLDKLAHQMRGRSPVRGSLLLLAILLFLGSAGVWAAQTELDDVTRAQGRVVPGGDLQVIEAAEPGVLEAVNVEEGDIVEEGQLLMTLDGTMLSSQYNQEQHKAYGLMARIARLRAEIDDNELSFGTELRQRAPEVVKSETALYRGRRDELASKIDVLERQRSQRKQELVEGRVDLQTAKATLAAVDEERALMEPLVERGIEPETTLLKLRRSEAEWKGSKTRAKASLDRLQSRVDEIDDKIATERDGYRSAALSDMAQATAELAALKPTLPALQSRAARAKLRAPVRGVVNRIYRSTIGSSARRGEKLIDIVPIRDNLRVEAYVKPSDIAFLYPGQEVKVKITAYNYSRYGSLDGEIIRIGADAIKRSERDEQEYFVVDIRTEGSFLDAEGAEVEIIPGMVAQVDILSGQKTVLNYLTRPVVRVKERALRE